MKRELLMIGLLYFAFNVNVQAEEIQLTNGDKVTGNIIEENDTRLKVQTQAMGVVEIEKIYIKAEEPGEEAIDAVVWGKTISIGYMQKGGDTKESSGTLGVVISRVTEENEIKFKVGAEVGTTNGVMDTKEFKGLVRYASNFGDELKWFNFYEISGEQDVFSNIYYRIVPAVGAGYWFKNEDDFKLSLESAVGYEYTKYQDGTSEKQAVLIPRGYLEKSIFEKSRITQEVILYPSLEDLNKYRIHSETAFINPVSEKIDWKLSFIDDYESVPFAGKKKNNYQFITALDVAF